jgi:hypothetical protein
LSFEPLLAFEPLLVFEPLLDPPDPLLLLLLVGFGSVHGSGSGPICHGSGSGPHPGQAPFLADVLERGALFFTKSRSAPTS